jgi:hypothetical protein
MKNFINISLIFTTLLMMTSCSSYNSIMRKAVKKSLGKDFKGYYAFSYPTNNFGLFTSFENQLASENQYCAMASCLEGIEPSNRQEWLHFDNLADVGEGAPIKLTKSKKTKIAVDAVLPKLWNAVQIEGGAENEREVKTTLEIGPAYVRFINKKGFEEFIEERPATDKYKQKYENGNLVVVVSDVVVEYLSVKIEIDNKFSAELDAKIEAGDISEKLGKVDLDAKLEKTSSGTYELTIDKPVIVLRLAKKQPSIKSLISADNFDDWEPVKDFIEN